MIPFWTCLALHGLQGGFLQGANWPNLGLERLFRPISVVQELWGRMWFRQSLERGSGA
jgi:hypothetical protein